MKLGTENKKKTALAAAALGGAVLFLLWSVWGSSRPTSLPTAGGNPAPAAASAGGGAEATPARGSGRHYPAYALEPTLDPRLRLDLLQDTEGLRYEGKGRNVFQEQEEEIPQPNAPGLTKNSVVQQEKRTWTPQQQPSPPPINLKFYGWASQPGEPKAIFLTQGDNAYVAYEGDIVARRYKVLKIGPNSVEIEDVLSNNRQSIPLGL